MTSVEQMDLQKAYNMSCWAEYKSDLIFVHCLDGFSVLVFLEL